MQKIVYQLYLKLQEHPELLKLITDYSGIPTIYRPGIRFMYVQPRTYESFSTRLRFSRQVAGFRTYSEQEMQSAYTDYILAHENENRHAYLSEDMSKLFASIVNAVLPGDLDEVLRFRIFKALKTYLLAIQNSQFDSPAWLILNDEQYDALMHSFVTQMSIYASDLINPVDTYNWCESMLNAGLLKPAGVNRSYFLSDQGKFWLMGYVYQSITPTN